MMRAVPKPPRNPANPANAHFTFDASAQRKGARRESGVRPTARFNVPPPTHPTVYEALQTLSGPVMRRQQEQYALSHRIHVLERAAERRRDAASMEAITSLNRSLVNAMRAPAVFSSIGAPNSARSSTPSNNQLTATLQGIGMVKSARGPPPPTRLLTPRQLPARGLTTR